MKEGAFCSHGMVILNSFLRKFNYQHLQLPILKLFTIPLFKGFVAETGLEPATCDL